MTAKVKLFFLISGIMGVSFVCSGKNMPVLPLLSPKSPFTAKQSEKSGESSRPFIKNGKIFSGNKILIPSPSGALKLRQEVEVIADMYMYFMFVDKTGKKVWFKIGDSRFFDRKESGWNIGKGSLTYTGIINKGGLTGKIVQEVVIDENGIIKFDIQFDGQGTLSARSMMISFSEENLKNMKIKADGKLRKIPSSPEYGFFKITGKCPHDFSFYDSDPEKDFRIKLLEAAPFAAAGVRNNSSVILRLFLNQDSQKLMFSLDILNSYKSLKSAGIDFKALDDLIVPCLTDRKNLMENPSFEQNLRGWMYMPSMSYKIGPERWESVPIAIDVKEAKFGNKSLKLTIKKDEKYPFHPPPSILDKGEYTFSFYIKGQKNASQLLTVYAQGSQHATGSPYKPIPGSLKKFKIAPEWKRHSLTFKLPASAPVRFRLWLTGSGSVWLDGLQLEKGNKATEFSCAPFEGCLISQRPGNVFDSDDDIDISLNITGKPGAEGNADVSVRNVFNEKLFSRKFKFKCAENGKATIKLPFKGIFPRGIFIVRVDYELPNGKSIYEFHRFCIMDFLENKHKNKNLFANDYGAVGPLAFDFGKRLGFWEHIGFGAKNHLGNWEKEGFDMYSKHNIKITDAYMIFRIHEKGRRWYSLRANHGRSYDFDLAEIFIKDYRLENPDGKLTDDYLKRFKDAVKKIVERAPWIRVWSLGGENDAAFPELAGLPASEKAFADYAKLQIAFYEAVKEADPECGVSNGAPCNMSPRGGIQLIERLLKAVNGKIKYDVIGAHCYRATPEIPDLDADLQTLFSMLEKYGYKDTPVILPEGLHYGPYRIPQWDIKPAAWSPRGGCWYYGPLTFDAGWTEKISAAWIMRSYLVGLKNADRVESMNAGQKRTTIFMDLDYAPGITQKAVNTLGHLLGNADFKKEVVFAPFVKCYIFEDEKSRPIAAVWNYDTLVNAGKKLPFEASASFGGQLAEIYDFMECGRSFKPDSNGGVVFSISPFPLFFIGKKGSLDKFVKAFKHAEIVSGGMTGQLSVKGLPVGEDRLMLKMQNYTNHDFNGKITVADKTFDLEIPALKTVRKEYDYPKLIDRNSIKSTEVLLVFDDNGKKFTRGVPIRGFVCAEFNGEIKIDGDLSDWKGIESIKLNDRCLGKAGDLITDKDFSGWFKTAWKPDGWYLCAKITDDNFVHQEFKNLFERWKNDSLQLYFDSYADAHLKAAAGYDDNDYEYAVYPSADGKSSVFYRVLQPDQQLTLGTAAPPNKVIAPDIPSAFKRTDDGYIYEVFIPAKYLLPAEMRVGAPIGFGMFVNDKDKVDGDRRSSLTLAGPGNGCYRKPHLWPVMVLTK